MRVARGGSGANALHLPRAQFSDLSVTKQFEYADTTKR